MLFHWKNSLFIKHAVGEDVAQELQTVNRQEYSMEEANHLLNKVTDRTVQKKFTPMLILIKQRKRNAES